MKRERERERLHRVCEPSSPTLLPEAEAPYHLPDEPQSGSMLHALLPDAWYAWSKYLFTTLNNVHHSL